MAQMTLLDFRTELIARGFDGFGTAELTRYLRWAEWQVARKFKLTWMEKETTIALNPGDFKIVRSTSLPKLKAVKFVLVTTADYEKKLAPIEDDDEFFGEWATLNLASVDVRNEPEQYYLTGDALYILPPPVSARNIEVHWWGGPTGMTADNDVPQTPEDMEEAILLGAEYRCHSRARQPEFAMFSRSAFEEIFNDEVAMQEVAMDESADRVEAAGWL